MASAELRQLFRQASQAEQQQNWPCAIACYRQAIGLAPEDHRLPTNLGNVLWLADQPEAARDAFRRASALAPDAALPHRGLGNALRDLNAFEAADAAYSKARQLSDDALSAWNHSQLLLGLERYASAYAAAERRLELEAMLPYRPSTGMQQPHPLLQPSEQPPATPCLTPLHLWTEQGFGDSLQYVRWLTRLCQQPHTITLEVEHQLVALFERGLSWLPHPPAVVAKPRDGSGAPALAGEHGPLLSLPHHLGGAPLTEAVPYLRSEAWPSAGSREVYPRIGLLWAAGRKLEDPFTAREYRKRSLSPEALGHLVEGLHQAGAQLVNLQVGHDRAMATPLASRFADALPEDADFAATAAVVRQLDLVICVDTAMAHLAGALGHPAWVLLPFAADPRWLRDRSDSPWYPSVRLFRQPQPGDWGTPIASVLQQLRHLWSQGAPFSAPT
jgi:tetratricopeptide (TPR) repeat protein